MKKILEIKNLNVSFKVKRKQPIHIVRGVDIDLKEGEIIGIVGESGSGKSVSTRALLDVNNGDITQYDFLKVLGKDIEIKKGRKKLNGEFISYIPQNPMTSMNPSRTIKNHIFDVLIVRKKRDKDFSKDKEFLEITIDILKKFKIQNIDVVLKSYPHELSGGMKQRIIIAMAILAGPKIIIADEPTTALDATVQSSVLNLIQKITKDYNISLIFISHNIAVIAKLCDYIYIMYAGKILEKGTMKEIFLNPKHPYTWALMASIPEGKENNEELYAIPGSPPDMSNLPPGDPFASRNSFAMAIDFKQEPPLFKISEGHYAATWTLHPQAEEIEMPKEVKNKISLFKKSLL